MVSRKISFYKSLTYRVLSIGVTGSIAYFITGSIQFAAGIVYLDTLVKIAFYYFHERLWEGVHRKLDKDEDWRIGTIWEKKK